MNIGDDEARRAGSLRDALDALRDLQADMRRSRPKKGYVRRILQVMACDRDDEGCSESSAWIELDLETGRKLVNALRGLIEQELQSLARSSHAGERRATVGRTPGSGARGEVR